MKLKHLLILFLVLALPCSFLSAQQHADGMAPLKVNPYLVNYANQAQKLHIPIRRLIYDTIWDTLPFQDDFSHGGPYPDTNLWIDNAAFINNTYPICPITIGVATLDGVNNEGKPYNPSCPPGGSFPADSLTSRPIRLNYPNFDNQNIWFSFYWQAGGRGFDPLTADSLLLQFRTSKTPWTTIWFHLGYSPVAPDTGFHLVMIHLFDSTHPMAPLDTTIRFNARDNNFQFRFKNYACTSADADQWNIDNVYLNKHRSASDSIFNDVTFVYESPRILANYEYMPWEQFTANDIADTLYLTERNNTSSQQQITYHIDIPSAISSYSPTGDINPWSPYNTDIILTHIPIKSQFTYTPLSGPTDMQVHQYFTFTGQDVPWNDTLSFDQVFHDFYAYDDGTAEASYFVYGNSTPIDLAEKIDINNQDTLRGVEVYFNYMYVNPTNYNMLFTVWDTTGTGGSPGKVIFQDDTVSSPRISDTLNGFTFYAFSKPVVCKARQSIYVGWVQTNGDSLNIGLDMNTNSVSKICYYDNAYPSYWNNGWNPATLPNGGSIMMRPVFGNAKSHGPVLSTSEVTMPAVTVSLYPNPANNMVTLNPAMQANTLLKVYTIDGREYMSNTNFYGNSINTSMFAPGFYIVEITPSGGQTSYQKLLIQR